MMVHKDNSDKAQVFASYVEDIFAPNEKQGDFNLQFLEREYQEQEYVTLVTPKEVTEEIKK